MNPNKVYKFCPICGGNLRLKSENLLVCQKCGFEYYINSIPCNAAIIENEKGEILLVKRKFDPQKGKWDWPGGFLDAGENFEQSVKREIREELGVEVEVGKITGAYTDTYLFQEINSPTICIVAPAKIIKGEIRVSDDVDGYKYFSKDEVLKQEFAFPTIRKGLTDYFESKK